MNGAVAPGRALSDRYLVERELARGGMGVVYMATDLRHSRPVAIKFLAPELAGAVDAARFHQEIQTLARLTHPHILPLHDSGNAAGEVYYVMPRVEGESLRQRLERDGPMRLDVALRVAREVADALAYAHARGVVHRDIKPENILLDGQGHAWVADFGIAQVLARAEDARLTTANLRLGSPLYMSPEQIAGERHLDGRSDVYSLGCVLYEMLTGQPPFPGDNAQAAMRGHLIQSIPLPGRRRADIGRTVDRLVQAMLAKRPEDRLATAEALVAALDAELVRAPAAPAPRLLPPSAPGRGRRRIALLAVALVGAALLAGVGWEVSRGWAGRAAAAAADGPSPTAIAVLPFEDHSVDGSLATFARGLTDDLIAELGRTRPLAVASYASVAAFPLGAVSIDSVARALGVGTVITGGVSRSGSRLRATADVLDARTGRSLGRVRIERAGSDMLALRDSLVEDVGFLLRRELGEEVQLRATRARARSAEAWELHQRARLLLDQMDSLAREGDTAAALSTVRRADSLLARAYELDPRWPDVLVERAWLEHRAATSHLLRPEERRQALERGIGFLDRALRLDSAFAPALEARGVFRFGRYVAGAGDSTLLLAAKADLEAAVRLDDRLARAWSDLGEIHALNGDRRNALRALEAAYRADTFAEGVEHVLYRLFFIHYELEQDSAAAEWCARVGRRSEADWQFPMCRLLLLGTVAAGPAQVAEARRMRSLVLGGADSLSASKPRDALDYQVAVVYARAGMADSALALVHRVAERTGHPPLSVLKEAEVLTALGRTDAALRLLEDLAARTPRIRSILWRRELAELREEPRYLRLVGALEPAG